MTVVVTRRKRESLVPVLFYYYNDAEVPQQRLRPHSAGSYTNTEMVGESLHPESWLAEQASWANTGEKRAGCLSSVVTQGTEHRNLWLCPARSSFSISFFLPVHSPMSWSSGSA